MKNRVSALCLFAVLGLTAFGCSTRPPEHVVQVLPADLQWQSNPAIHSLKTVTLAGDPAKPEPYAQRIKFPPNHRLEPHRHTSHARMVTVLSGTLYFAYGDTFDESKLRPMTPGSFFTEPFNMYHYARAGSEDVVLQLHAIGPDATIYAQPAPAKKPN